MDGRAHTQRQTDSTQAGFIIPPCSIVGGGMGDETAALMHNQRQITADQFSEAERGGEVGCRQTDDLSRKKGA